MPKAQWLIGLSALLAVLPGCQLAEESRGIVDTFPPIPEISQGVALAPFGDGGVLLVMFTARSLKSTVLGPDGASDWRTLDTASEGDQWGWICPVQGSAGGTALLYGRPLRFLEIGEESDGEPVPLFEWAYFGDWLDCAPGSTGVHVLYQEGGGGVDDGVLWYGLLGYGGDWVQPPVKVADAVGNGVALLPSKADDALLAYTISHSDWQEAHDTPRMGSLVLVAMEGGEAGSPEIVLESVGLDAQPALGGRSEGALTLAYIDNLDDTIQILERAGPAQQWQQTELAQLEPGPIGALSWPAGPVLVDMGSGALAILFATMTFPAGNDYDRPTVDLHMCTREGPPGWECAVLFSGTFALDRYPAPPWLSATRHDGRLYAVFVNPNGDAVQVVVVEGDGEVGTYVVEPPH